MSRPRRRYRDGRGFFEANYVTGWRLVIAAVALASATVVWLLWTHGVDLETVGWGLLLFLAAALPLGGVTWLLAVATRTSSAIVLGAVTLTMEPAAHAAFAVTAMLVALSAVFAWRSSE